MVILQTNINPLCNFRIHRNHEGAPCIKMFWDFSRRVTLIRMEARLLVIRNHLQLCELSGNWHRQDDVKTRTGCSALTQAGFLPSGFDPKTIRISPLIRGFMNWPNECGPGRSATSRENYTTARAQPRLLKKL